MIDTLDAEREGRFWSSLKTKKPCELWQKFQNVDDESDTVGMFPKPRPSIPVQVELF